MKKILTFGASISKQSINKKFAGFASTLLEDVEINLVDLNDFELPLYSIDLEKGAGIPKNAQKFNDLIEASDGIIISMAEHNGSYTAAFKNLYDWLSRIDKAVWKSKPMLVLSTSPGKRGGASVMETALNSFPHLGGNIVAHFSLASFNQHFVDGQIVDQTILNALKEEVAVLQNAL